jgi:hypothetical protein
MAGKKSKQATSLATSEGKWATLPHQSKEKPVDHYADDGGGASKRKVGEGKPGRHDPCEEFGYGDSKKRKAPAVKYAEEEEEEEEWEDEDVVVLSDKAEAEEDEEDEGILFDKHTVISEFFVYVTGFCNCLPNLIRKQLRNRLYLFCFTLRSTT